MTEADRDRYFVVSPHKTGTTSIERALLQIGAGRRAMPYGRGLLQRYRSLLAAHRRAARGADGLDHYLRDHGEAARHDLAGLIEAAAPYDVFADAPLGHGHVHPFTIRAVFPQARMIWVDRPFDDWADSVRAWEVDRPELYRHAPLWETDPDRRRKMLRRMRRRRLQAFRRLEDAVPDACLRVELGADGAMAALARFCGRPDPGKPLPHLNAKT